MKKGVGSRPPSLRHSWSLTPGEARNLQTGLRAKLRFSPLRRSPRTVAGADISHLRFGRRAVAEVVVFSFPDLERIEESLAVGEVAFPYVPGLLSFREGPLLERAFEGLRRRPDLVLFDGQGIWVTQYTQDAVQRLALDGTPLESIPTGNGPYALASIDGVLWISNFEESSIIRVTR